ncbi:MAG: YfhO family protein [Anaerolineae bacterium]|nr:YfhO family protein [Anaerolineae bacterium]
MTRLRSLPPDAVAVAALVVIWLWFFWRLFTPVQTDQASLEKGDFSGQFVAFAAYQYDRFAAGEIPLWNPYNNGGLPFIGDTQAAVFYPPRLITIALSRLAGGWSYHALELEMAAHVLACSLLMFLCVRRLTQGEVGSTFGAFISAVIASYGGFLQSYPPLQLALLEAAIWLPLGILGIHEAARAEKFRWPPLLLTGLALGLSWLAGHPQTSWFLTYLLTAYLAYRVFTQRHRWWIVPAGTLLFGGLAFGLAAVQLLPGFEYLAYTTRANLGFEAKGNGFPFHDVIQFIIPNVVTQWSPLYVGLIGLVLAGIALWRKLPGAIFWGIVAILALGLSFGDHSPLFALLYNVLPGLRFFRGQERAAYLVSFSLAILAGLAAAHLVTWDRLQDFKATRRIQQAVILLFVVTAAIAVGILLLWLGSPEAYAPFIGWTAFTALVAGLTVWVLSLLLSRPRQTIPMLLVSGLLVFDLFTVSIDRPSNYDPIPPTQQLAMTPSPLLEPVLADTDGTFRIDGYRGLHDNYGSLYRIADMRDISPLFLAGPFALQQGDLINPRAWELFAVRYVYTDWNELPVASIIMAEGQDRYGPVKLHRLTDPRPFALLVDQVKVIPNAQVALDATRAADFDPRRVIILDQAVPGQSDGAPSSSPPGEVTITHFAPEQITLSANTSRQTILSLSLPYYPGWQAAIDSTAAPTLKAYGAFSALVIPPGSHTIELRYDPQSFRLGAGISLLTVIALIVAAILLTIRHRRTHASL